MREYELTYIVRPDIDDEAVAAVAARVEQTIATHGGRVLKSTSWGKRRLAYPIRRYHEGTYILLRTEMADQAIREVERHLKLSEDVIRHLLVRAEEVGPAEAPAPAEPTAQPEAPGE